MVFAAGIEAGLHVLPFSRLLGWLGRLGPSAAGPCVGVDARRLRRLTLAGCRVLPVTPTCLRTSLVLFALLRRRGAAPVLRIGVRKVGPDLTAHAWVECDGLPPGELEAGFRPLRPAGSQARDGVRCAIRSARSPI